MLKKFKRSIDQTEQQEIAQEERELKREYLVFVPMLIALVIFITFAITRSQPKTVVELVPAQGQSGYWLVYDNGMVESFGTASPVEKIDLADDTKITSAQAASTGFWAMSDGGQIYALAGAEYAGGVDGVYSLHDPVDLIALPNGRGYRIADKAGKVYDFNVSPLIGGDANTKPNITAATTQSGEGYWLIHENGEISSFGDAQNFSTIELRDEVILDASSYGNGLVALTNKGRVIILGDGKNHGDLSTSSQISPLVDIDAISNTGYRITDISGKVTNFGDINQL